MFYKFLRKKVIFRRCPKYANQRSQNFLKKEYLSTQNYPFLGLIFKSLLLSFYRGFWMRNYISKLSTIDIIQFHNSTSLDVSKRSNCKNVWLVNHISAQPSNSLTCSFKIQHNPLDSFPFIFSPNPTP